MDHTVSPANTHYACLYLVSVYQRAPPLTGSGIRPISAYYSFIDPKRIKQLTELL